MCFYSIFWHYYGLGPQIRFTILADVCNLFGSVHCRVIAVLVILGEAFEVLEIVCSVRLMEINQKIYWYNYGIRTPKLCPCLKLPCVDVW